MKLNNRRLNNGENTCDKCGVIMPTEDLVWITADDFTPYENEMVPVKLYKMYDALCEDCYLEEIKIKVGRR